MSARRILIVNLTRLGDLLQTSPTVAGLRALHPDAEITLLAEKNFAEVCEAIPGVDRVHRIDLDHLGHLLLAGGSRVGEAFHFVRNTVAELRAGRFDLALNFSSSRMSAVLLGLLDIPDVRGWSMTSDGFRAIQTPWARLFATLCLNRRVAGFNLVDCYRGVAGCLSTATPGLSFTVSDAARARVATRLDAAGIAAGARVIALQLGASRAVRRWPIESFARLAHELAGDGKRIVLVGGGGERALAAELLQACGSCATPLVDLCGQTSIQELGALLERCALLVTGDTGPMHMAAATRTPIVGLFFGPALPFDTGPYGTDHVVLHAGVSCAPCDHAVHCLDPFCRRTITAELVASVVRARLAADWSSLAEIGTALAARAPVRLYRTGFDARGLFDCPVLGTVLARPEDELRRAYRATWLTLLEGVPLPGARSTGLVDVAPFAALAELARLGTELTARLDRLVIDAARSLDAVQRVGREIEVLDRAIGEHGRVHPDVAVLTQMFAFEKETMPGEDLAGLTKESARLYRDLCRSADCMQALLGGSGAVGEVDHASIRQ